MKRKKIFLQFIYTKRLYEKKQKNLYTDKQSKEKDERREKVENLK